MKVGLDYFPAVTHAPGIGRYARELVRAMVRLPDCPELHLLDLGRGERTIGEPALGLADAPHEPRVVRSTQSRRMFSLLRRSADGLLGGVDLFHRTRAGWPPVARAKEILPIAEFPPDDAELAEAARSAAAVLVFSSNAAAEVERRYGVPADRIHRVPVGCDHWTRDLGGEMPPKKDPPQILVLGSLRERRRPGAVLRAVEELKRRRVPCQLLYVGGERGGESEHFLRAELGESIARDLVLWNRQAKESDMAKILASSSLLVHLSEGEETAVTPLEAFSVGVPVVASRLPAFEEALGDLATLVDRDVEEDALALSERFEAAIASAADDAACAKRGALGAENTWEKNAAATVDVYRKIIA